MKSLLGILGASVLMSVGVYAQSTTTQTNPETQNTGQTSSAPSGMTKAPTVTQTGQPQTWTGQLIDANCTSIKSMRPALSSSNAMPGKVGESIEGGSAEREAATSTRQSQSTTSNGDRTTTTASREEKKRTAESSAKTDPDTGTRARTRTESSSESSATMTATGSSSDPYPSCHVTSSTSSFAVSSNGQVYFLDEASNSHVRQQLQTDSSFSGSTPMNVVVMGNANGPEITVTTLQKSK